MYRRPKFLEVLIRIREEMAREADYDTDLFTEMVRSGRVSAKQPPGGPKPDDGVARRRKVKVR